MLIQLDALSNGDALRWRGPGIKDVRSVELPLPAVFWQQRQARSAFPRGLDAFFAAGEQVIGLPRSTRVLLNAEEAA